MYYLSFFIILSTISYIFVSWHRPFIHRSHNTPVFHTRSASFFLSRFSCFPSHIHVFSFLFFYYIFFSFFFSFFYFKFSSFSSPTNPSPSTQLLFFFLVLLNCRYQKPIQYQQPSNKRFFGCSTFYYMFDVKTIFNIYFAFSRLSSHNEYYPSPPSSIITFVSLSFTFFVTLFLHHL